MSVGVFDAGIEAGGSREPENDRGNYAWMLRRLRQFRTTALLESIIKLGKQFQVEGLWPRDRHHEPQTERRPPANSRVVPTVRSTTLLSLRVSKIPTSSTTESGCRSGSAMWISKVGTKAVKSRPSGLRSTSSRRRGP
jgi:hypothetical protein